MVAPRMLGPEVRRCYQEGAGFITAVGVNIILGQIGTLTAYEADGGNRVARTVDSFLNLLEWHAPSVIVGVVTIALIIAFRNTRLGGLGLVVAIAIGSVLAGILNQLDLDVEPFADLDLPPVLDAVTVLHRHLPHSLRHTLDHEAAVRSRVGRKRPAVGAEGEAGMIHAVTTLQDAAAQLDAAVGGARDERFGRDARRGLHGYGRRRGPRAINLRVHPVACRCRRRTG